jgi:tetratricopeptide (TPR) repeat protein
MEGFEYFRSTEPRYIPKTSSTALKALFSQLLPEEAFIYLGTSAQSLDEEPVDLDALERMLSRPHLDLETNRMLRHILNRLVKSSDPETALFAAESINLIENRYNTRIGKLKEDLKEKRSPSAFCEIARQYYELAQLSPGSIRMFYLREAYGYLLEISRKQALPQKEVLLIMRVLLELGQFDRAIKILEQVKDRGDPAYLLLEAEIEFKQKNFLQVLHLCMRLYSSIEQLDESAAAVLNYWLGE